MRRNQSLASNRADGDPSLQWQQQEVMQNPSRQQGLKGGAMLFRLSCFAGGLLAYRGF